MCAAEALVKRDDWLAQLALMRWDAKLAQPAEELHEHSEEESATHLRFDSEACAKGTFFDTNDWVGYTQSDPIRWIIMMPMKRSMLVISLMRLKRTMRTLQLIFPMRRLSASHKTP